VVLCSGCTTALTLENFCFTISGGGKGPERCGFSKEPGIGTLYEKFSLKKEVK
jgi:hypothetical protein